MSKLDIGLTVINVVLAIISGVGAYRSIKYFRKSRNLAIYAQTNAALTEIQKMLMKLPEALAASNKAQSQRGFSLSNTLCKIGQELDNSLNEIRANIPRDYLDQFERLQSYAGFNLRKYINSFISGEVITDNEIDSVQYNHCQERLIVMQAYLKEIVGEMEEKLK